MLAQKISKAQLIKFVKNMILFLSLSREIGSMQEIELIDEIEIEI